VPGAEPGESFGRFEAKPDKKIVDRQAASPSSWKAPSIANSDGVVVLCQEGAKGLIAYAAVATGFYQQIAVTLLIWLIMLAPLGAVLFLSFRIEQMSALAAQTTFWTYAALMGLSLASVFLLFTGTSIARVFFIAAGTFAAMSLYGYTTQRDLSQFGSFLFMGLIGIVLACLVNIFIGSSALQFAIWVIGVIVFTGLTAWDT
jgi:uncharacterized protein